MRSISPKTQAEAFVFGLIEGLVTPAEVGLWAEDVINQTEVPEDWAINLWCGNKSPKEIVGLLHAVPSEINLADANDLARELLARRNKPFRLFDQSLLPPIFKYPKPLIEFAETGIYPYFPSVWFLDASHNSARNVLTHVQEIDPVFVPFAHLDDRFPCFHSVEDNEVYVLDIVDKKYSRFGTFQYWLESASKYAQKYVNPIQYGRLG